MSDETKTRLERWTDIGAAVAVWVWSIAGIVLIAVLTWLVCLWC